MDLLFYLLFGIAYALLWWRKNRWREKFWLELRDHAKTKGEAEKAKEKHEDDVLILKLKHAEATQDIANKLAYFGIKLEVNGELVTPFKEPEWPDTIEL